MTNNGKSGLRLIGVFITAAMLTLMLVGLLAIRASERAEGASGFCEKQFIFSLLALAVFLVCAIIPYPRFGKLAYGFFGFSLFLLLVLAACRFFKYDSTLIPSVRGAYRWINLGFFQVQPSEIAKLAQILLLAWYLRLGDHYRKLTGLSVPFILTFVPLFLILIEPDLGTSLLFLPILFAMLFMAGAKASHLIGIIIFATLIIFLPIPQHTAGMGPKERTLREATAYWVSGDEKIIVSAAPLAKMEFHQLERIDGWLRQGDTDVIQDTGFQLHQSKIVLGSGKITGRSDWSDADFFFRMLPDDHTDFIFSIIGGQWGFVGCLIVILLYVTIVIFGVLISVTTNDPFGRLLAIGVVTLLVSQFFINSAMTMGILPITGMTLPLISYGGSSLIINCAAIGLLVNVGQRRPIMLSRRPFEHSDDYGAAPYRPLEYPPGP